MDNATPRYGVLRLVAALGLAACLVWAVMEWITRPAHAGLFGNTNDALALLALVVAVFFGTLLVGLRARAPQAPRTLSDSAADDGRPRF